MAVTVATRSLVVEPPHTRLVKDAAQRSIVCSVSRRGRRVSRHRSLKLSGNHCPLARDVSKALLSRGVRHVVCNAQTTSSESPWANQTEDAETERDAETWRQIMQGGEDVTGVMADMIKLVSEAYTRHLKAVTIAAAAYDSNHLLLIDQSNWVQEVTEESRTRSSQ